MLNKNQVKDVLKLVNQKLDSTNSMIEMIDNMEPTDEVHKVYLEKMVKELFLEKNRFTKIQTILKNNLSDYEGKELHT